MYLDSVLHSWPLLQLPAEIWILISKNYLVLSDVQSLYSIWPELGWLVNYCQGGLQFKWIMAKNNKLIASNNKYWLMNKIDNGILKQIYEPSVLLDCISYAAYYGLVDIVNHLITNNQLQYLDSNSDYWPIWICKYCGYGFIAGLRPDNFTSINKIIELLNIKPKYIKKMALQNRDIWIGNNQSYKTLEYIVNNCNIKLQDLSSADRNSLYIHTLNNKPYTSPFIQSKYKELIKKMAEI